MATSRRRSRELTKWQLDLIRVFDSSRQRAFSYTDLARIVADRHLGIPAGMSVRRVMTFLATQGKLREVQFTPELPDTYGPIKRYVWGDTSPYARGLALRRNAYLSHASAVFLHGLTNEIPKTIYVNREQSAKPSTESTRLTQESIDRAFKNKPRTSRYIFVESDHRYVLLSGKATGRLEVSEIPWTDGELLQVTKLERTLIDLAVRPTYGGGPFQVLAAFSAAREKVSARTLLATLKKLKYVYPYHQAIGFYMERAGYETNQLEPFRRLGFSYDFYLTHAMSEPLYSPGWRLFYPQGL